MPRPPRSRYAVAIVGAGPTGLMLANLLGCEGVATLLLERNASTVSEPRAVSIDDESLRTAQAVGLVDEVLANVIEGYGAHYFAPSGRCFARIEPATREFGFARRSAFRQPFFEATLREGLARFDKVDARFGHRLEAHRQSEHGVELEVRAPDGEQITLLADYLIGADGASSAIRESLGIAMEGTTFNERWLIVDMEGTPDRFRHTRVFCDPARPAISLPGPPRHPAL